MNFCFILATILSYLVILSFPLLFRSNWTSYHQTFAWPFSLASANFTLSGSSISSCSKYSSSSLIQLINSFGLSFLENVGTLNLGLFPILVRALKSFSSSGFKTSSSYSSWFTCSSSLSSSLSSLMARFIPLCIYSCNASIYLWRAQKPSAITPTALHAGIFVLLVKP